MSGWVAGAVVTAGALTTYGTKEASRKAGSSAEQAARVQEEGQQSSLDYLKETEAVPQQYREQAIRELGGMFGLQGQGAPVAPGAPGPEFAYGGTQPEFSYGGAQPEFGYEQASQQDLINRALSSPLYQQLMGGREAGEEAILRNASATGGLRSGNVQANLYDYNTQLQNQALQQAYGIAGQEDQQDYLKYLDQFGLQQGMEQQDYLRGIDQYGFQQGREQQDYQRYADQFGIESGQEQQAYNRRFQGLTGLAGIASNAPQIANTMQGIGQTQAQGIMAQGQIAQDKYQGYANTAGNVMGQLGPLLQGTFAQQPMAMPAPMQAPAAMPTMQAPAAMVPPQAGSMYSDRRLKKNIKKLGERLGFNWYEWDWNIVANKMGLAGSSRGVLADEIHDTRPECISIKNLFMVVDYDRLLGDK